MNGALTLRLFDGPRPKQGAPLTEKNHQLAELLLTKQNDGSWRGRDDSVGRTGLCSFGRLTRGGAFLRDLSTDELSLHIVWFDQVTRSDALCTGNDMTFVLSISA